MFVLSKIAGRFDSGSSSPVFAFGSLQFTVYSLQLYTVNSPLLTGGVSRPSSPVDSRRFGASSPAEPAVEVIRPERLAGVAGRTLKRIWACVLAVLLIVGMVLNGPVAAAQREDTRNPPSLPPVVEVAIRAGVGGVLWWALPSTSRWVGLGVYAGISWLLRQGQPSRPALPDGGLLHLNTEWVLLEVERGESLEDVLEKYRREPDGYLSQKMRDVLWVLNSQAADPLRVVLREPADLRPYVLEVKKDNGIPPEHEGPLPDEIDVIAVRPGQAVPVRPSREDPYRHADFSSLYWYEVQRSRMRDANGLIWERHAPKMYDALERQRKERLSPQPESQSPPRPLGISNALPSFLLPLRPGEFPKILGVSSPINKSGSKGKLKEESVLADSALQQALEQITTAAVEQMKHLKEETRQRRIRDPRIHRLVAAETMRMWKNMEAGFSALASQDPRRLLKVLQKDFLLQEERPHLLEYFLKSTKSGQAIFRKLTALDVPNSTDTSSSPVFAFGSLQFTVYSLQLYTVNSPLLTGGVSRPSSPAKIFSVETRLQGVDTHFAKRLGAMVGSRLISYSFFNSPMALPRRDDELFYETMGLKISRK